jgi:hypothetical protein
MGTPLSQGGQRAHRRHRDHWIIVWEPSKSKRKCILFEQQTSLVLCVEHQELPPLVPINLPPRAPFSYDSSILLFDISPEHFFVANARPCTA